MRLTALVLAASLAFATPATAELHLSVDATPEHALALQDTQASVQAELIGMMDGDIPFEDLLNCTTLTTRLLPTARAADLDMNVIVARYNLVGFWLGDLCPGADTSAISPAEGYAWLDELAGLRSSGDGSPFLRARHMMLEFYLFGAPGFAPDRAAARAYLATQDATRFRLYAIYLADEPEALALTRVAAEAGDNTARALMAQRLELGRGVPRDEAAAFAIYSDLAEKSISPPVWYRLGLMHRDGRSTPRDPCQARRWLSQAAGHARSPVTAAQEALAAIPQGACPR